MGLASSIFKSFLRRTNFYRRRLANDGFPGPVVLCYHAVLPDDADRRRAPFEELHVSESRFNRHCEVIAENCCPITLEQYIDGLADPKSWPERAVLITFDDGYRSVVTVADPILRRFAMPATLFTCTSNISTGEPLWYDRIASNFGEEEAERLKDVPDDVRKVAVANSPAASLTNELEGMSVDELRALARNPAWSIGGHSHSHAILARCPADVQRKEIEENLAKIESYSGARPAAFAYPNGRPGRDYDDTTKRLLSEAGIEVAFTTQAGFTKELSRPYDLPRMLMLNSVSGSELLHRMAISWR